MTYNLFLCSATDSIIIILFNLFFVIQRHKNEIPIQHIDNKEQYVFPTDNKVFVI